MGTFRTTLLKRAEAAPRAWLGSVLALGIAAILLALSPAPALADLTDTSTATTSTDTALLDPLHGYCPGCTENTPKTNTPTSANPIKNFGFTISPGPNSGDFQLAILTPDNEAKPTATDVTVSSGNAPGAPGVGAVLPTTATQFGTTPWTSGDLMSLLNLKRATGAPPNPLGAFLGCNLCAQAYDTAANFTGFFIYTVDLGQTTLAGASGPGVLPSLDIGPLPVGSYILGFLSQTNSKGKIGWISTAQSGALLEVPEPGSLAMLVVSLAGFALTIRLRNRRRPVGRYAA